MELQEIPGSETETLPSRFENVPPAFKFQSKKKVKKAKKLPTYCVFCKNNNESEAVYTSHVLKDPSGRVVCPALYVYVCPICNNTGHQAHTVKHCPYNPEQLKKQTELAEIWRAYRETKPCESMAQSRPPVHIQPLSSSTQYNCRLVSPPALSTPSSSPMMSPNSSGYFSQPSSPDYSCFSSPTRQAQDMRQGENSILMENLIKLLHISN